MSDQMNVEMRVAAVEFSQEGDAVVTYRFSPDGWVQDFNIEVLVKDESDPGAAANKASRLLAQAIRGMAAKAL